MSKSFGCKTNSHSNSLPFFTAQFFTVWGICVANSSAPLSLMYYYEWAVHNTLLWNQYLSHACFQWMHIDHWAQLKRLLSQVINKTMFALTHVCILQQNAGTCFVSERGEHCAQSCWRSAICLEKKKKKVKKLYANYHLALLTQNWAFAKQRLWRLSRKQSACLCSCYSKWNLKLQDFLNHLVHIRCVHKSIFVSVGLYLYLGLD